MGKLKDAKSILSFLQVPQEQQTDLCCHTLLALSGLKESDPWVQASNEWLRIHDIITFLKQHYGIAYAENSRETIRKQAIHHFRNAAFIEDNAMATNHPNYRYRLTEEMLALLRSFQSEEWDGRLRHFQTNHLSLIKLYQSKRDFHKIPVQINGERFAFSTGAHNRLQRSIIEEFAPRFAPNSICLYVGDTTDKALVKDEEALRRLGFTITLHDTMPDVVLYSPEKNWLYFIEAVTSVGPMSPQRVREIDKMTGNVSAGKVFVTAFPDYKTFKKFSETLAWETEVWIADVPDHMIHLNGDRFFGPRK